MVKIRSHFKSYLRKTKNGIYTTRSCPKVKPVPRIDSVPPVAARLGAAYVSKRPNRQPSIRLEPPGRAALGQSETRSARLDTPTDGSNRRPLGNRSSNVSGDLLPLSRVA
ncbi:unnamed protein product, partial [Nesidiocoris tenuis]